MQKTHFHVIFRFFEKRLEERLFNIVEMDVIGNTVEEAIQKAKDISTKLETERKEFVIDKIIEHDHMVGEKEK